MVGEYSVWCLSVVGDGKTYLTKRVQSYGDLPTSSCSVVSKEDIIPYKITLLRSRLLRDVKIQD